MRRLRISASIALSVVLMSGSRVPAQQVRDLTERDLTADTLVQVLKEPKVEPGRTTDAYRGIGVKPPDCKHFHDDAVRGIELVPKADIAAITLQFAFNSAELTPASEKNLDALGQALGSATLKPCCFAIEGYTDSIGGDNYNRKLSIERARSVINYLDSRAEVERQRTVAAGFGKAHPIASNETEEGRQKNRRVEVVNLGHGE
jgi:outer membrane protein OmpA-like peptidoglycan-associated protein